MLEYIYFDLVHFTSDEEVFELMQMADRFLLKQLKIQCESYFAVKIKAIFEQEESREQLREIYSVAQHYNFENLVKICNFYLEEERTKVGVRVTRDDKVDGKAGKRKKEEEEEERCTKPAQMEASDLKKVKKPSS